MKTSTRALCSFMVFISVACSKQDNASVEPSRRAEDALRITDALSSSDSAQAKEGLNSWLTYYPDEINRVFPQEETTALGLVSLRYFAAAPEAKEAWLEVILGLLDQGADPNISFPYQGKRRGLLHLAAEKNEQALMKQFIAKQGTIDPPLRLACELAATRSADDNMNNRAGSNRRINLNAQEENTRMTPLHYAVLQSQSDLSFIEFLLQNGANPDISDAALNLVSPFQLAASQPILVSAFQKYSGAQIRYDSRLNSFLNDEIEAQMEQRKTILDMAKAYQDLVNKEGFQEVQDINRVIPICQTGEDLNILGYSLHYLLPAVSTKAAQAAKARNDSIQALIKDYGAQICSSKPLKLKDSSTQELRELGLKDYFKEVLALHTTAANAPVKTFNRTLWCSIVRPKAVLDGCWDAAVDDVLVGDVVCPPL